MKKRIFALALIALTVGTSLVSCTKDENPTTNPKAVAMDKATLSVKVDEASNVTGKSVNRTASGLPVSIGEVDVTATSTQFTWTKMFPFTLTDLAIGTVVNNETVQGTFTLDNIAVGSNNISVTTKSQVDGTIYSTTSTVAPTTLMPTLKAIPPYAVYEGHTATNSPFIVVQGGTNVIPTMTLTTSKGRNIAVFTLSQELKDLGAKALITANSPAPATANGNSEYFAPITVTSTDNGVVYWNNEGASGPSQVLNYTVTLLDKNGVALAPTSQIPNSNNLALTNVPSTSTNTIYTIKQGALVPQTATQTFNAVWNNDNDNNNGTIGND